MMSLTEQLQESLITKINNYEEERKMPLISPTEQMAMEKGIQKGIQQERLNFIFRLLKRKVGDLSSELEGKIRNLSRDTLEDLGEALLDFNSTSDLIDWLDNNLD